MAALAVLLAAVTHQAQTVILPAAERACPMKLIRYSTAHHIQFWPGVGAADAAYSPGSADRAARAGAASSPLTSVLAPDPVEKAVVRYQNRLAIPERVHQTTHRWGMTRIQESWA
jgi:hypothetical protein